MSIVIDMLQPNTDGNDLVMYWGDPRLCAGPLDAPAVAFSPPERAASNAFLGQRGSIPTTGVVSVCFWVRPDAVNFTAKEGSGYVHLVSKGGPNKREWAIRMYSGDNTEVPNRANRISAYAFNPAGGKGNGSWIDYAVDLSIPKPQRWLHVAVVYSLEWDTISMYRDGVLQRSRALTTGTVNVTPVASTDPIEIAGRDGQGQFQGALYDVRIFDHPLGMTEIGAIMGEVPR